MPFKVLVTRHPGHVHLAVTGEATMPNFVSLVETAEQETVFWADRRVLVDLTGVTGALSPEEEVFLGELTAHNLSHLDRLASVVAPQRLTRNSETAARQGGLALQVFDRMEEALAWIGERGVPFAAQPPAAAGKPTPLN